MSSLLTRQESAYQLISITFSHQRQNRETKNTDRTGDFFLNALKVEKCSALEKTVMVRWEQSVNDQKRMNEPEKNTDEMSKMNFDPEVVRKLLDESQ